VQQTPLALSSQVAHLTFLAVISRNPLVVFLRRPATVINKPTNVPELFGLPLARHSSDPMFSSNFALSASSAAISRMISHGLRWGISSPPFGFFTDRSNFASSMALASTLQLFDEAAKVFCNFKKSARSSSFSGFVLPKLRPGRAGNTRSDGWVRPSRRKVPPSFNARA